MSPVIMIAHASTVEHLVFAVLGAGAVAGYCAAWLRLPRTRWMPLMAWAGAVVGVLASTSPSVERWAAGSFTGHMVQHLVLVAIVPPLAVLARPLHTIGALLTRRHALDRAASRWWRRWSAVVAPIALVGVLFGTHLTPVYDAALRYRLVHDLEHIAYLGAAVAVWSVALAPSSRRGADRVGAAFAVIAGGALLGVVLTSASRPLIETYVIELGWSEALADQRRAGSLMWIGGMALGMPLLLTSVWHWAAAEQRRVERAESLRAQEPVVGDAAHPVDHVDVSAT